ncbi:hypothetical protein JKF63_05602 [Porcisia hertigi]|uniref:SUI1 domain-containing protein n=1 Tax=Porcisia hertigi TaxID=2761500 RepID=A0A836ILI5_9TRYP|nr:hypothetical protein JKF63_05602 [Porcisia hertigi]
MEDAVETIVNQQRETERAVLGGQKVHIRVQQRKGKKFVTTVQGLNQKLNFRRINREFQRRWGCNGTVIQSTEAGTVIQLQGNWSEKIKQFLLEEHMATENNLEIHSL